MFGLVKKGQEIIYELYCFNFDNRANTNAGAIKKITMSSSYQSTKNNLIRNEGFSENSYRTQSFLCAFLDCFIHHNFIYNSIN